MIDWNAIDKKLKSIIINKKNMPTLQELNDKGLQVFIKKNVNLEQSGSIWNRLYDKVMQLNLSPQEWSLLKLVAILYQTEGPLSYCINYILFSLMLKGKKIPLTFKKRKKRYADSVDDLFYNITLNNKVTFLKNNNFAFMSKICPRDIRNAIAHQDFIIESDGTVTILKTGKKITTDELDEKIKNLVNFILIFRNKL